MKVFIKPDGDWLIPVEIDANHAMICLTHSVEQNHSITPWYDGFDSWEALVEYMATREGQWVDVEQFSPATVDSTREVTL